MMKKLSETLKEMGVDFTFPIEIKDSNGNQTYIEVTRGYWSKREYDSNGNEKYIENSDGYWCRREFDSDGSLKYYNDSDGRKKGVKYKIQKHDRE